ncbi:MAG TPA: transglycosylase domain-containing protein [Frankiaceae bacterium]|jgi:membrane peptidoglycan carboxypeptidase|nr:transglycosylase domain-containing protein [Frankiaceae bacterium]
MTTTPETDARREAPEEGPKEGGRFGGRTPWAWWKRRSRGFRIFVVVGMVVPALLLIAAAGIFYATTKVPLPQSINTAQVSTITYRDGKTEIMKIGSVNRTNVALSAVSLDAQHAVLAAEDKNFYSESGISWTGIARALWADVRGHDVQGGSTITQQYVKNAFLSQQRSFTRKLKEIAIAIKLAKKYSKDQILEFYLNTIYFGRGAYGIQAASESYFAEPASKLTAAQGAVLAGLIRAPSVLDPRINPDAARTRFRQVVDAMAGKNWLTQAQADALTIPPTIPLSTTGPNAPQNAQDAYIRDAVISELRAHGISEDEITRGGLHITTTLDPVAQKAAVDAVTGTFAFTPVDVQPALVAIQPGTGEVRAWYGGRFYGKAPNSSFSDYVDNVTDPIQPGSSFKPIALAAALKKGISLNSYYNGNSGQVITPGYPQGVPNFAGESVGQINLLQATAQSINSVFVPLARDAGTQNVIDTAHALGIPASEKLPAVDALPLGVAATSPLNLTDVYATFAAQGVHVPAHLVAEATDSDGTVVYKAKVKATRVLSPSVAADETYALQQVFEYGTAAGLSPGRPVAGKTGTTDGNVSTWLCGYSPQLASCVAVSRANHLQSLNGIFNNATEATGASTAGHTWQTFMAAALAGQPVLPFPAPAFGGTTSLDHAAPPPPPPAPSATTSPPASPKPTQKVTQTPSPQPTQAPPPTLPVTPTPTPSSGGLLGGLLGGGGGGNNPGRQSGPGGGAAPQ